VINMAASFDLFYLFVEQVFGGLYIAGIGLAGIFFLIGVLSGLSFLTTSVVIGLFLMVYAIGCIGGPAAFLFGTLALVYAFYGILNFINSARG